MRLTSAAFLVVVLLTGCDLSFGQVPTQRAWEILQKEHHSHSTKERVNAVRALGQLPGNFHAVQLSEQTIADNKPDVRAAAALTLGRLGSRRSILLLKEALKDKNTKVALAASSALVSVGDSSGYVIYRDVLVGKAQERGRARCGGRAAPQRSQSPFADDAWSGRRICSLCWLCMDGV